MTHLAAWKVTIGSFQTCGASSKTTFRPLSMVRFPLFFGISVPLYYFKTVGTPLSSTNRTCTANYECASQRKLELSIALKMEPYSGTVVQAKHSKTHEKRKGLLLGEHPLASGKTAQNAHFAKEPQSSQKPENRKPGGGPKNHSEIPCGAQGGSCLEGLARIPL